MIDQDGKIDLRHTEGDQKGFVVKGFARRDTQNDTFSQLEDEQDRYIKTRLWC